MERQLSACGYVPKVVRSASKPKVQDRGGFPKKELVKKGPWNGTVKSGGKSPGAKRAAATEKARALKK